MTRLQLPDRQPSDTFGVLPSETPYDAATDMRRSIEFAYKAIRARVARGGRGWRGWPENPAGLAGTHLEDQMNIDRFCDEPCCTDDGVSTATPAGIQLARKAIERLGHPCTVSYVDLADAFTPKKENGEPCHIDGYEEYLSLGTDITCDCVLQFVLRHCGYTDGGSAPTSRVTACCNSFCDTADTRMVARPALSNARKMLDEPHPRSHCNLAPAGPDLRT
jgi:hypothetical protein